MRDKRHLKTVEKSLLRAMTDVDDAYILDALNYGKVKTASGKKRIRKWIQYAATAAACLVLIFTSVNVTGLLSSQEYDQGAGQDASSMSYETVADLTAATEKTGFDFNIPAARKPYDNVAFAVIDKKIIEVSYYNQNKTILGYALRKARGSGDISGDNEKYAHVRIVNIGGRAVTLRGNNDKWIVATWAANGYTYAVYAQHHPMSFKQITAMITAMN